MLCYVLEYSFRISTLHYQFGSVQIVEHVILKLVLNVLIMCLLICELNTIVTNVKIDPLEAYHSYNHEEKLVYTQWQNIYILQTESFFYTTKFYSCILLILILMVKLELKWIKFDQFRHDYLYLNIFVIKTI